MPITVSCPKCSKQLRVRDELVGKKLRCPGCGNTFDAKSAVFRAHDVPALTVVGPPELARKLVALPDGAKVQIEGVIDRRSRTMLLDVVQPLE